MTGHDAKVIVEDAVRDARRSNAAELVVPVSRSALAVIRGLSGTPWFEQQTGVLCREGKTVRFVISGEAAA